MKGNMWAIAVLFIGLVVLLPAINIAHTGAVIEDSANESTTVDYDNNYTLGVTDVQQYTSMDVSANNTTLSNGTDYTFHPDGALIDWHNTSTTSDGDAASVNYTYEYYDDTTKLAASVFAKAAAFLGIVAVMAALGYLLVLIPGGSGW